LQKSYLLMKSIYQEMWYLFYELTEVKIYFVTSLQKVYLVPLYTTWNLTPKNHVTTTLSEDCDRITFEVPVTGQP
jgi:hypothetical protein